MSNITSRLPLYATISRIIISPLVVILLFWEFEMHNLYALILYALTAATDWLDGHWARKFNAVSDWGKLLDPAADKVLVSTTLLGLLVLGRVDIIAVIILINRDVLVSAFRSYFSVTGQALAASNTGKWKTFLQMVAIGFLIYPMNFLGLNTLMLGKVLIWISVVLSVISAIDYFFKVNKKNS